MGENESGESRSSREKAEANLLSGGERVAKGRQRSNGDEDE